MTERLISDEEMFMLQAEGMDPPSASDLMAYATEIEAGRRIEALVRKRLAERLRTAGKPHTYASENADVYRAYQAGCERAARIVEGADER